MKADWLTRLTILERTRIPILAAVLASGSLAAEAATFTVTNTNDSGTGSLRQAILDSHA